MRVRCCSNTCTLRHQRSLAWRCWGRTSSSTGHRTASRSSKWTLSVVRCSRDVFLAFMSTQFGAGCLTIDCSCFIVLHSTKSLAWCLQFYHLYNAVQSQVITMKRSKIVNRPNRVVVYLEDGSIRLISPKSGNTMSIVYPLPFHQVN